MHRRSKDEFFAVEVLGGTSTNYENKKKLKPRNTSYVSIRSVTQLKVAQKEIYLLCGLRAKRRVFRQLGVHKRKQV